MAFIKPTVSKVRSYDVPGAGGPSNNGMIVNPPRFEEFGGLRSKARIGDKNKMSVTDRGNGKHGPFGKN